jgi:subtilisin family serine protease
LFGFNRNNIGGDPVEVMPFTVTSNSEGNIMVIKNEGPDANIIFKYIIFRGEAVINEYNSGTSTIVGQANAEGAMTVGAVLYSNTPAYGVNPPTIASFSSIGGTPVNGVVRNKPDFTGPNGVNTTVYLGGVNIDGDLFPNFFGTSAAAPHIAGVAALIMEARQRFYSEQLSPQQVRTLLQTTAVDMNTPGFDYVSGYGFCAGRIRL